jgi:uncharacterized protein (DUF58 family)
MTQPSAQNLARSAQQLGQSLPALLAQAQHLAAQMTFGAHGRKRAGSGDEFWQYRPAVAGDAASAIDWRRSARADTPYLREREWQARNTVGFWVDTAQSMAFASAPNLPSKGARAQLLALALCAGLLRGGEKVGLIGTGPARSGRGLLSQIAADLANSPAGQDYGAAPPELGSILGSASGSAPQRAVYISDFLGPLPALQTAMMRAADSGARGILLQILDPEEESFPFSGRIIFQSMGGSVTHETLSASDLRARYVQRLSQRKDALLTLARSLGWDYSVHHTDTAPLKPLIWAHGVLSGKAI